MRQPFRNNRSVGEQDAEGVGKEETEKPLKFLIRKEEERRDSPGRM